MLYANYISTKLGGNLVIKKKKEAKLFWKRIKEMGIHSSLKKETLDLTSAIILNSLSILYQNVLILALFILN